MVIRKVVKNYHKAYMVSSIITYFLPSICYVTELLFHSLFWAGLHCFIMHFSILHWKGVVLTDFPNDVPLGE